MISIGVVIVLAATFGYSYLQSSSTITGANNTITSLRGGLAAANSTIANLNSKVSSLSGTIKTDNSTIQEDQSKITQLLAQVAQDQTTITGLQNQVTTQQNQLSQLRSQIQSLNAQISSLENQMAPLLAQAQSLAAQVSSLQSQRASLQSQLSQLEVVSIYGTFSATSNCPYFFNCTYIVNGAYANYGTNTANSVTVTFTFYSGLSANGQVLCSTSVVLGTIQGRTISSMPQATCSSSYSNQAQSYTWLFKSS